jgi:hypothetical protein
MGVVYIYGLIDPRNELIIENVRYVGKTKNAIRRRLSKHIEDSRKKKNLNPKDLWINNLLNEGIRPAYIELKISDNLNWVEDEKYFIEKLKNKNNLLNISAGGLIGGNYYHPSIELYCYDENGDFKIKYSSMTEACNDVHVSMSKISLALNQKTYKSSANCYWFTNPQKKENIIFRKAAKRNIPIIQKTLMGEFVAEFCGQGEAEKLTGISSKLINKCLRIPTYSQTNGYMWEYKII